MQFLEDNFYREVGERPMLEHLLDELASKQQESIGNSIELPRINQKPFRDVIHQLANGECEKTIVRLKTLLSIRNSLAESEDLIPTDNHASLLQKYLRQLTSLKNVLAKFK